MGVHLGPIGPRLAPCWPHEPCYQGWFRYISPPRPNISPVYVYTTVRSRYIVVSILQITRSCSVVGNEVFYFYRDVPTVLAYYSQSMGCGGIYEAKESGSNEWIVLLVYFRYNDYQPQFIRVFLNSVTNIFADFDEHCLICSQWDILCDIPRKYAQRCKVYSDNYVRDLCLMLVSMCFMWDEYIIFFSILFHWHTMAKSALNGMGKYLTWIAWGHTMRPPQS